MCCLKLGWKKSCRFIDGCIADLTKLIEGAIDQTAWQRLIQASLPQPPTVASRL